MNPILKKLHLKPGYRAIVRSAPASYAPVLAGFEAAGAELAPAFTGKFDFIHVFAVTKADVEKNAAKARKALKEGGLFWVSYPKGKALATDLNRDILHAAMQKQGFEGVSLVSIDEVWSAMRFKKAGA